MTCVKTGCHIYIIPYGLFAYGDAHQVGVGGDFFFRLVDTDTGPLNPFLHYEVNEYDSWWDKNKAVSTLVAARLNVISYGYEGRETHLFPFAK